MCIYIYTYIYIYIYIYVYTYISYHIGSDISCHIIHKVGPRLRYVLSRVAVKVQVEGVGWLQPWPRLINVRFAK